MLAGERQIGQRLLVSTRKRLATASTRARTLHVGLVLELHNRPLALERVSNLHERKVLGHHTRRVRLRARQAGRRCSETRAEAVQRGEAGAAAPRGCAAARAARGLSLCGPLGHIRTLTTRSKWPFSSGCDTGVYGRMTGFPPSPMGALTPEKLLGQPPSACALAAGAALRRSKRGALGDHARRRREPHRLLGVRQCEAARARQRREPHPRRGAQAHRYSDVSCVIFSIFVSLNGLNSAGDSAGAGASSVAVPAAATLSAAAPAKTPARGASRAPACSVRRRSVCIARVGVAAPVQPYRLLRA